MKDVLESRNLVYYPRTQRRKGSIFGNTIQFCDKSNFREEFDDGEEVIEDPPSFNMQQLSADFASLEATVTNAAFAKIGRKRSHNNPGPSNQTRRLGTTEDETFLTRNLLECHKPQSALSRIASHVNHRLLAYYISQMIFKYKSSDSWFKKSVEITQPGRNKHEFLSVLVGICLLFPTLQQVDATTRDKFFENSNDLVLQAVLLARNQLQDEQRNHEIAKTILALNSYTKKFSFNGLSARVAGQEESIREQKWLLLRATVFQRWLLSERAPIKELRHVVLSHLGVSSNYVPDLETETHNNLTVTVTDFPIGGGKRKLGQDTEEAEGDSQPLKKRLKRFSRRERINNPMGECPLIPINE